MNKISPPTSINIFLFFTLLAFSQSVFSHARWNLTGLVKPRTNSTGLKEPAPCGGVARTNTAVVLQSGSTVNVQFEETINHPGYFRIAFSSASDSGFDENILIPNIPEIPASQFYTQSITLPDIECNDCTLQLIQVMTDRTPPTNYYSCADIQLTTTGALPPPVNDTTAPLDVGDFSANSGDTRVTLNWTNPSLDFSSVLILQDTNTITGSPTMTTRYNLNDTIDGASVVYLGNDETLIANSLTNGNQYHFKIFTFDASLNYSAGVEANSTLPANPENIQPVVTLTAEQSQTETTRVINNAGNVILQAIVIDDNPSDTHQLDWTMTDNRLIDIDKEDSNFTFNPAELEPGVYVIEVQARDNGVPTKSGSAALSIEVFATTNTSPATDSSGSLNIASLLLILLIVSMRLRKNLLSDA